MPTIKRMVHVSSVDMDNTKEYRGFRNPFLRAISRSFPEAKYIWMDEYFHLNFIDSEDSKNTIKIPVPLHIQAWLRTYQTRPTKCDPISFGITFNLSKEDYEQLQLVGTDKSTG